MATTVAHHATVKVLAADLASFEQDVTIRDKKSDSDDDDDEKTPQKTIKGDWLFVFSVSYV